MSEKKEEKIYGLSDKENKVYKELLKSLWYDNGRHYLTYDRFYFEIGQTFTCGIEVCEHNFYYYWLGSIYITDLSKKGCDNYGDPWNFNEKLVKIENGRVRHRLPDFLKDKTIFFPVQFEAIIPEDKFDMSDFRLTISSEKLSFFNEEDEEKGLTEEVFMRAITNFLGHISCDKLCRNEIDSMIYPLDDTTDMFELWESINM
jgi:hypothetical protein